MGMPKRQPLSQDVQTGNTEKTDRNFDTVDCFDDAGSDDDDPDGGGGGGGKGLEDDDNVVADNDDQEDGEDVANGTHTSATTNSHPAIL